jgi:hypothetical protein
MGIMHSIGDRLNEVWGEITKSGHLRIGVARPFALQTAIKRGGQSHDLARTASAIDST